MKNLLIATTALVATATVAAADVKFSGYARFGAKHTAAKAAVTASTTADAADATDAAITAASRLRLQADMTAASDNGLSFAARYRIQGEENAVGKVNAGKFSVSAGALTVAAGNICGAIECMPGVYNYGASAGIGLEGNGFLSLPNFSWDAYDSAGAGTTNGVEVVYSAGGMGVHISSSKDAKTAVVVSYSAGALSLAAAYQDDQVASADNDTTTADDNEYYVNSTGYIVTAGYDAGSAKVGLTFADGDEVGRSTVVKASTTMGGMGVYGFIGDREGAADNAYGVGVSYALGGGTSFEAGMASGYTGHKTADAGFLFKF